jgi:dTDP-4-amino-4,6-dideoxygalactose transaminase
VGAGVGPGDEVITTAFRACRDGRGHRLTGAKARARRHRSGDLHHRSRRIAELITPRPAIAGPSLWTVGPYPILDLARHHGLKVVGCRAGARCLYRPPGRQSGDAAAGFYPGKNLRRLWRGGCVSSRAFLTGAIGAHAPRLGSDTPYHHAIKGFNARMDGIQEPFSACFRTLDRGMSVAGRTPRHDEAIGPGVCGLWSLRGAVTCTIST